MKQSLAAVLTGFQGLGSDDSREKPVDRLAALGQIQNSYADATASNAALAALGVALISFKFANRPASKQEAEDMLAIALSWKNTKGDSMWGVRLTAKERDSVARQAIVEWALDFCPPRPIGCGGAGEVPAQERSEGAQPMRPCPVCRGTRRRRFSDLERIQAMGKAFEKAMDVAHSIIGDAERLTVRGAKDMLERW
jgi:hypothetical protein